MFCSVLLVKKFDQDIVQFCHMQNPFETHLLQVLLPSPRTDLFRPPCCDDHQSASHIFSPLTCIFSTGQSRGFLYFTVSLSGSNQVSLFTPQHLQCHLLVEMEPCRCSSCRPFHHLVFVSRACLTDVFIQSDLRTDDSLFLTDPEFWAPLRTSNKNKIHFLSENTRLVIVFCTWKCTSTDGRSYFRAAQLTA